jgi:ATP-dependent helicase/nuclease subunit B
MITFLTGRSGSGKSRYIYRAIREAWEQTPPGTRPDAEPAAGFLPPLILLVPEQYTLQAERELIAQMPTPGLLGIEVMSFRRLGWRVLEEAGGRIRTTVDATGKQMLIWKLLQEHAGELELYCRLGNKNGFIRQLGQVFSWLKQENISAVDLARLDAGAMPLLQEKLTDIGRMLGWFQAATDGRYQDQDDRTGHIIAQMKQAPFLRGARIWVDHFYHFTTPDLRLLGELMTVAAQLTVAFTLNPEPARDGDIFSAMRKNQQRLVYMARQRGLAWHTLHLNADETAKSPALRHLEREIFALPFIPYPDPAPELSLDVVPQLEDEIELVARRIMAEVREHRLRFSDIAILGFDLSAYADSIRRIFTQYAIPFFIDEKRGISATPLVRLVLALLRVFLRGERREDVMAVLKTGLAGFTPTEYEILENYARAYGIEGFRWHREFTLGEATEAAAAEEARLRLQVILEEAFSGWKEADNFAAITRILYDGLEQMQVRQRLDEWILQLQTEENWDKAAEYAQTWAYLINCLEQIDEILGATPAGLAEYSKVLEAGLAGVEVGMIPVTVDQVMIGAMQRSIPAPVQALYVIGLTAEAVPGMLNREDILTAQEQDYLHDRGLEAAKSQDEMIAEEYYLIYRVLNCSRGRIAFSYPLAEAGGGPSIFLRNLQKIFPQLQFTVHGARPEQDPLELVFTGASGMKYLTRQLRGLVAGQPIDAAWREVYAWYEQRPEWIPVLNGLTAALQHRNQVRPLDRRRLDGLYRQPLRLSVSRLEQFARCPFAHFVQYGLRPQPRREFELRAPDIGNFLHQVMQEYGYAVAERALVWEQLDAAKISALLGELLPQVKAALDERDRALFESSYRRRYLYYKVSRIAETSAGEMTRQIAGGDFIPRDYELFYGPGGKLPALHLALPDGSFAQVEGRIDRIDVAHFNQADYFRVIDYKSSARSLHLAEVYHGVNLQLPVYLLAVLNAGPAAERHLAGAFYFAMGDPWMNREEGKSTAELREKRFRLSGLYLDEAEVRALTEREKKGQILVQSAEGALKQAELDLVLDYTELKITEFAGRIASGAADICPVQSVGTACDYCDYRSVCHFDPELGNAYNDQRNKWKRAEALEQMKQGLEMRL